MSLDDSVGRNRSVSQAARAGWAELSLLTLIAAMPFLASPLMAAEAFGVGMLRLYNIVPAFALFAFLSEGNILPGRERLERRAFFAFAGYAAFAVFVVVRALPHLNLYHALYPEIFPLNPFKYLEERAALPLLVAVSFVYVLRRMSGPEGISRALEAITFGVFAMSCVVLAAVAYQPDALFSPDPGRSIMLSVTTNALGMHYNAVGTVLAMTAPLLLYMALNRGSFWTFGYMTAFAAVLVAKSRTGLFDFVGISAVAMLALGRGKTLVAAAPLVAGGAIVLIGPELVHLLSIGFSQRSGFSLFFFLSGREQAIWLPVLAEWFSDPERLLLGAGAHGILDSIAIQSGMFGFQAGQAHNLYLEFFLDNGLVLFLICAAGLGYLLWRGYRIGKRVNSGLYWSLYLCIVSFLITGLSGRLYYPDHENYLMFPIVATLINVARLRLNAKSTTPRTHLMPSQR